MRYIKLSIIGLIVSVAALAQTIQTLPADPAVKSGVLPNGMTYYIASNPSFLKGMADLALVQKTGALTVPGADRSRIVAISQDALSEQSRLTSSSVQDYFLRLGVIPGRNGFAEVTDNATIFRFENVLTGQSVAVMDSTLLVLMGMAEKAAAVEDSLACGWYSPSDQALIVAGDVDADQVEEKVRMLSYMISASASLPRKEYVWTEQDSLHVVRKEGPERDLVTVTARWRLQRTPREFMNTVQPAIYERYMTELGIVAEDRIARRLKEQGIPYADVSYDYVNGIEALGDESFAVSLSVAPQDVEEGLSVMSSVLFELDASDAQVSEVKRAHLIYMEDLKTKMKGAESNSDYVDRCISAFVYNSPLTSKKDMLAFNSSRDLSDETERVIFNSIVSASLDGVRNLTLEYDAGDGVVSADDVCRIFRSSWLSCKATGTDGGMKPAPLLYGPGEPVKVRSSKKDPLSGGTVWTLSNGFKVVIKQMPAEHQVYYALALNGGYANVADLVEGEGACLSDILKISTIGGVGADRFFDVIRQKGMTMDLKVGLSSTVIDGRVPDDGLEYMFRVLLTVMNDRKTDRHELDHYIRCEHLRHEFMKGSVSERISAIDSIMCPDYTYRSVKAAGCLSEKFADKADAFMASQSRKMNDGVLILVGDIDEKQLKTLLQTYAGGFRTDMRTFARPVVNYQPISGTVMRTVEGEANSVDMVLSVPMALTAENHYVAAMAAIALKKELIQAVSGTGMWLRLNHNFSKDPHERFNIMISLNEASVEGFVPGTAHEDPVVALDAVRNALDDPQSLDISDKELASYKALLKKYMVERKKEPEYWLRAIAMRYSDGKDFTTGCDAKIDAVTVGKVKALLSSLVNGSRVEYIINRK